MNKLQMAHEMALAIQGTKLIHDMELVSDMAWKYADAMQAEADKRAVKLPDVFFDTKTNEEWQPDWSQAPDSAMYWAMDGCGQCNWYERGPEVCGSQWDFGSVIEQSDTGYDYQGKWQDSLRKRPQ